MGGWEWVGAYIGTFKLPIILRFTIYCILFNLIYYLPTHPTHTKRFCANLPTGHSPAPLPLLLLWLCQWSKRFIFQSFGCHKILKYLWTEFNNCGFQFDMVWHVRSLCLGTIPPLMAKIYLLTVRTFIGYRELWV